MLTATRIRPEFGNCLDSAILGMEGGELQETKLGSVKAVLTSYWKQILDDYPANKKFETNYSKKPHTETRELQEAKKMVKDLTRKIEESNSRAKALTARRSEEERRRIEEVLKETQSVKREITKLKLHTATVSAEKRRAEKEMESSMSKALAYSSSVEGLNKEIELIDEEHVLVEVAKIEARKELRDIEARRREDAGKYSAIMEEMRKKKLTMIQQIGDLKKQETKLAVTESEIGRLESKLKQVKSNCTFQKDDESDSATLLESVRREVEAKKKEMASIEVECFEFKSSIDVNRDEIRHIVEKADAMKKKEGEDTAMQSLHSELLRSKAKLEASSAGAEKAKSTASNLSTSLEQIESESRKAEKEQVLIIEETALIKAGIQKTKTETESAEERLRGAWKNLEAVKSSEAIALEYLKAVIQNTVRRRASISQNCATITISKFEYDYLKGNAAEATQIAGKKVEAAEAWVEALKASEKLIQMKTKRETVEKEREGSMTGRRAKGRKSASFTLRRRK